MLHPFEGNAPSPSSPSGLAGRLHRRGVFCSVLLCYMYAHQRGKTAFDSTCVLESCFADDRFMNRFMNSSCCPPLNAKAMRLFVCLFVLFATCEFHSLKLTGLSASVSAGRGGGWKHCDHRDLDSPPCGHDQGYGHRGVRRDPVQCLQAIAAGAPAAIGPAAAPWGWGGFHTQP